MNPGLWITIGVIAAIVLLGLYLVTIYNRLVQLRNRFENGYQQIDVQLKRRHDLVPNLVETVKGSMGHERETLEAVIQARNQAATANSQAAANPRDPAAMEEMIGAEATLGTALGKLFALVESYPDLKANQNMLSLQEELASTENRIAFARQAYNDAVMAYNTRRESIPDVFIANLGGFAAAVYWEIEDTTQREAPQISFSNDAE